MSQPTPSVSLFLCCHILQCDIWSGIGFGGTLPIQHILYLELGELNTVLDSFLNMVRMKNAGKTLCCVIRLRNTIFGRRFHHTHSHKHTDSISSKIDTNNSGRTKTNHSVTIYVWLLNDFFGMQCTYSRSAGEPVKVLKKVAQTNMFKIFRCSNDTRMNERENERTRPTYAHTHPLNPLKCHSLRHFIDECRQSSHANCIESL